MLCATTKKEEGSGTPHGRAHRSPYRLSRSADAMQSVDAVVEVVHQLLGQYQSEDKVVQEPTELSHLADSERAGLCAAKSRECFEHFGW